jgi:sugar lactone lactonase YvrE
MATESGTNPSLKSIGPLAFGPDGTLFAADTQAAAIFALDLGAAAKGGLAPRGRKGASLPRK